MSSDKKPTSKLLPMAAGCIAGGVEATAAQKRSQASELLNISLADIQAMIAGPRGGQSILSALRTFEGNANVTESGRRPSAVAS